MKFTEGYWEKNERANMIYAVQAFETEAIEGGVRIISPAKRIGSRADALDTATLTTEITRAGDHILCVRSWHFQGFADRSPRFEKNTESGPAVYSENEEKAVLKCDDIEVTIRKDEMEITFEAGGELLTSCGFRNLGYSRYDRARSTMLPGKDYMQASYDPYMEVELSLNPGAYVYGLGERFTPFVKNGQTVECWNEDGGTSSQIAYKNVPFYITDQGYGIFIDHTGPVYLEVASEKVEYVGVSVPGEEIRYYLICGKNMKEILNRYTLLTGRAPLPPAWSFGLWLSTSFTTDYDEETANRFLDGMKEREIPVRVFHFDCFWMRALHWCDFKWDEKMFPDVRGMLARYQEKGLKICVWINPYIAQGTETFLEGMEHGYFLMRADGKGVKQIDNWQPGMALVDFTNPEAAAWYQGKLKQLLEMGVDCFKTDFGERIPIDVVYHDGSDPMGMHNYYSYIYNKCVFDLLSREKGEREAVLFARSATAGGQKFPVHWGGDCSATFRSMAETLRGGLSFMLSGFSFWSHDMGGFEMTASPALYKRWVQFGLLSTHSRLHGSKSYRVPWLFDEESCEVCRKFTQLKYRLMPYLYAQAAYAHETGIPVMRPMVLEFEDDPAVSWLDMQYMLGGSVLVAPVFREDGKVQYYLPEGRWTHFLSGERRSGEKWYKEQYDFFSLPLYIRENTILPLGGNDSRPDYDYTENLQLHFFEMKEKEPAVCRIVGTDGKDCFWAKAEKKDGCLEIEMSGLTPGLRIVLRGIHSFDSVEGGAAEKGIFGTEILPDARRVRVRGLD